MRPRLPFLLAAFALSFGSLAADERPVATILCYHEVDPPAVHHTTIPRRSASANTAAEERRYTASIDSFRAQLDYLEHNGYSVIPLAMLVDFLEGCRTDLPPRAVVLTVDDGWACAFSEILPELRKRNMPFSLFVYPKIVGRGSHALSWDQIEAMAREGVDIQSHTFSHPFLTQRNNDAVDEAAYPQFLRHELLDSRRAIEEKTGRDVRFLCYPFGDYDDAVAAAARGYGYEAALTTERGAITRETSPMRLKRYLVHNDTSLEEFQTFLIP